MKKIAAIKSSVIHLARHPAGDSRNSSSTVYDEVAHDDDLKRKIFLWVRNELNQDNVILRKRKEVAQAVLSISYSSPRHARLARPVLFRTLI